MALEQSSLVELPTTGRVAIELLLLLRTGRAATAGYCYRVIGERLELTSAQLHSKIHNTKSEYAWHNRVRTARNELVKSGLMHPRPFNSWRLTSSGLERATKLDTLFADGIAGV